MATSTDWTLQAQTSFVTTFNGGPYTSFIMVDYLLNKAQATYDEFVVGHAKVLKKIKAGDIMSDNMDEPPLAATWRSNAGRCTSFAVKITSDLTARNPGVFDFKIHDLWRHRVARCLATTILIDSSSKLGAFPLPEGEWKGFEEGGQRWKWKEGTSLFERDAGTEPVRLILSYILARCKLISVQKKSSTVITAHEAMKTCLMEVASQCPVLILFR